MRKCECHADCDAEIADGAPFLNVRSFNEEGKLSTRKVLIDHVGRSNVLDRDRSERRENYRLAVVDELGTLRALHEQVQEKNRTLVDELAHMDTVAKELRADLVKVAGERDEARNELRKLSSAS